MSEELTVQTLFGDLSKRLSLTWVAGKEGTDRFFSTLQSEDGSASLVGHFNLIHPNQLQLLGSTELQYLAGLRKNSSKDAFEQLFSKNTAAILITDNQNPPDEFVAHANARKVPLLRSPIASNEILNNLRYYFTHMLADRVTLHGVFLEVLSIGVLLIGESGVGKSELALELITRGHRLIADDAPEFARIAPDIINGTCPAILQDFLEVRGLGILNIRAMYGDSVIKSGKYLRLILELKQLEEHERSNEDRLISKQQLRNVLGLEIPVISIPVAPGRNLAVLVEAAVRNHLLRLNGYNAGDDLANRQARLMQKNRK